MIQVDMMVHASNHNSQETEVDANLGYTVSSRPVSATQLTVLKKKKSQTKPKLLPVNRRNKISHKNMIILAYIKH